jgi:putative transposase
MARPLRLEHEGALWHITSRGNDQMIIFRDDDDRRRFLAFFEEAAERFNWIVHSYTLMDNHYHLMFETPEKTLSSGMQWVNSQYASSFNRKYKRRGHLFQGRFHSVLVEKEEHLAEVIRYIVLNPVRAGMVARPEDWEWSSYPAMVGLAPVPAFLETDWTLSRFAVDRANAIEKFRQYVDEGAHIRRSPFEDLVGQIYLGSAEWIEKMQAMVDEKERCEEHPKAQRNFARPTMEKVVETVASTFECAKSEVCTLARPAARMLVAWLGWNDSLLKLREIREVLGLRSNGTVSDLIRRCKRELTRDPALRQAASACRTMLAAPGRTALHTPF